MSRPRRPAAPNSPPSGRHPLAASGPAGGGCQSFTVRVRSRARMGHGEAKMDAQDLHDGGLRLRCELFGAAAVEQRVNALGEFGAPLQHVINAYAYGDIWSRPGLPLATKSLAMIAMMAATGKPVELRGHLKGALKNGCSAEEIREILLLVALYCGIPASIEAHKIAVEVLREAGIG